MKLVVTPLQPLFVAKITGVDLGHPIDEATQRAIERAMDTYALCVMPGQHLEDEEQIAFSRLYGPLEVSKGVAPKSGAAGRKRRIAYRELFDISNLDEFARTRAAYDALPDAMKRRLEGFRLGPQPAVAAPSRSTQNWNSFGVITGGTP
jgi:alpha-ketoglutarate-dependent 2,4-dichlorophenoxyacetate dioxygenase